MVYKAPDGGWGWVVTFSAFMISVIVDGISYSFGIIFKDLLDYFDGSKGKTSWIISALNGTYLGIGPVASILVTKFGVQSVTISGALLAAAAFLLCVYSPNIQIMIVLYGLLGGFGLGLMYIPAIVSVGHFFTKKRALASGIACCGSGIGGFVFAPLMQYLIKTYSWKGAMWILSAIALNGAPLGALIRPLEVEEKNGSDTKKTYKTNISHSISAMFETDLLKSPTALLYGFSCFFCSFGFYIPFTFLPDLANEMGISPEKGAVLISIIGIVNTIVRVLAGWLGDRSCANPVKINGVVLLVCRIANMFVPWYTAYGAMATSCAVFGTGIAVFVAYQTIITSQLLGIEKLTSSYGLMCLFKGSSTFIGAPIAGALADRSGDYKGAFYLAGASIALSGLLCLPLECVNRWEKKPIKRKTIEFIVNDGSVEIGSGL